MKLYYTMYNVGAVKYLLNFHDGIKSHNDGGAFYDINCFKNKKKLEAKIKELLSLGYKERTGFKL